MFVSPDKIRAGSEEQKLQDIHLNKIRSSKDTIQIVIKGTKVNKQPVSVSTDGKQMIRSKKDLYNVKMDNIVSININENTTALGNGVKAINANNLGIQPILKDNSSKLDHKALNSNKSFLLKKK